ncbi:MAG: T9SS type A sorting domain-containing protein [Flavobacteriaceae bacterium]
MIRKILLLAGILSFSLTIQSQEYLEMIEAETFTVQEIIDNAEAYFENKDKGRGSGYIQFKRWEYNASRLINENGMLPSITENLAEVESFNAYLNDTSNNRQVLDDNWEELGPTSWNATTSWNPGVGRITSIAIDPLNANHIIVGANTGGVWRTIDAGGTWTPLGDYFSNLNVYAVAIDPQDSDIYYFGSSSGLIYKSLDAGSTWSPLADLSNSLVNKIVIHPTDSDIIFASSQNAGMYVSTDGGITWDSPISDTKCYDIEFKPGDPSVVYVSGYGFHKSVDGGVTFTTIGGFPSAPKMIGVSPDDNTTVYVVEADNGSFGGFYSSVDSGGSFTELDHTGRNYFGYDTNGIDSGGQAPRDMDIAVNPLDVNEVHIAGVLTWRSMDGGVSFENTSDWVPGNASNANVGYNHADVDILVFDGTTLYTGSDGGIFKAENTASISSDYYTDITSGLGIRQFYKLGISQTADVVITGGSQDNGSSFYTNADGWKDWIGADGMEGFVDKDNTNTMYGMYQFGGAYRTDNGATSINYISTPADGNWVTPFEQDPLITNSIYIGLKSVYKSENKGGTWTSISQDFGDELNHLKIAPSNNLVMFAVKGTIVYKTEDGGATDWAQITSPGGIINSIAIHPTKPDKIAVATSSVNKVFVSEDGGTTWINYKFNLPNFSALALVWDNNGEDGLYLGMNYGLFYIDQTFTEWQPYNNNLPNVIINELEINSVDEKIYAASYGRGIWASPKYQPIILNNESFITEKDVVMYPNPTEEKITFNFNKGTEADFRVYDLLGKLVIYQPNISITEVYVIDVSKLNNGVYFIRISTDEGSITKKIIKE